VQMRPTGATASISFPITAPHVLPRRWPDGRPVAASLSGFLASIFFPTLMSIAGHLSRKMLEHYSHIRMAAKRAALDAIVQPGFDGGVAQNWAQPTSTEDTAAAN
jgi:hypothetical protein